MEKDSVDGRKYEVEIHFVHTKKGNTDMTEKNHFCVVAVFADVTEEASISGPWADILASLVQPFEAHVSIDGFVLDKLLPENRDYYFYHGSLTTPPYSENVAWVVLKNSISVPSAYLEQLRQVQADATGKLLTHNFRELQEIAW